MGYNTVHSLTTIPTRRRNQIHTAICNDGYDMFEEECKWYDCEADVVLVSKDYPDVIICIEGVGEEHPDHWIMYVVDGVVEKYKQPAWTLPPPSSSLAKKREANQSKAEFELEGKREAIDRAEYERLKAKFGE